MERSSLPEPKLFIGGKFTEPASGEYFETENPARGEPLTRLARGGEEDVDLAVQAAKRAFETTWRTTTPTERESLLRKLAELVRKHSEDFAYLDAIDAGKPISDNRRIDVPYAAKIIDYYAGVPTKLWGRTNPVSSRFLNVSERVPYGVCALITPWNFPLINVVQKLAPAIACGNTVVLKPAEEASLSALLLARLVNEAGFPPGVVNVITGLGHEAGAALVAHPQVRKVAFTGSTETGRKVMQNASAGVKPLTLELGGKSANIVFADADLNRAAAAAASAIFYNSGQVCTAGSRLFVERSVFEQVVEAVAERAKKLATKMGDPLEEATRLGPVVSRAQFERVLEFIEQGKAEARLVVGGEPGKLEGLETGYFVAPTVFVDVPHQSRLAQEEIFGPVLCVFPFDTEEEVLSLANDVKYGLAAAVWSRDLGKALRVADRLEAGTVWINGYNVYDPAAPFGGVKASGFGQELGFGSIEAFTTTKNLWLSKS